MSSGRGGGGGGATPPLISHVVRTLSPLPVSSSSQQRKRSVLDPSSSSSSPRQQSRAKRLRKGSIVPPPHASRRHSRKSFSSQDDDLNFLDTDSPPSSVVIASQTAKKSHRQPTTEAVSSRNGPDDDDDDEEVDHPPPKSRRSTATPKLTPRRTSSASSTPPPITRTLSQELEEITNDDLTLGTADSQGLSDDQPEDPDDDEEEEEEEDDDDDDDNPRPQRKRKRNASKQKKRQPLPSARKSGGGRKSGSSTRRMLRPEDEDEEEQRTPDSPIVSSPAPGALVATIPHRRDAAQWEELARQENLPPEICTPSLIQAHFESQSPSSSSSSPDEQLPQHFDKANLPHGPGVVRYSKEHLIALIKLAEDAWTPPLDCNALDLISWQMDRFGLSPEDNVSSTTFLELREMRYKPHYLRLIRLKHMCISQGLIPSRRLIDNRTVEPSPEARELSIRLSQVMSLLYAHYRAVAHMKLAMDNHPSRRSAGSEGQFPVPPLPQTFRGHPPLAKLESLPAIDALLDPSCGWEVRKFNIFTVLYLYLLSRLAEMGARRYRGNIWVPKQVTVRGLDGRSLMVNTGSYRFWNEESGLYDDEEKDLDNVTTFVQQELSTSADSYYFMLAQENTGMRTSLIMQLRNCEEDQFPVISKFDKHIIAFRNLVYSVAGRFPDGVRPTYWVYAENRVPRDLFAINFIDEELPLSLLPSGWQSMDFISQRAVAEWSSRNHDRDQNHYEEAWERCQSHVPTYTKLLRDQFTDQPEHEQSLIHRNLTAMLGKSWFHLKEIESWEMMMFIYGPGGGGKSKFIELPLIGYPVTRPHCFGGVMNADDKTQRDFALNSVAKKAVLIVHENDSNIRDAMSQRTLTKMLSGEPVSCARKHINQPLVVNWSVPIAMAGNAMFNFSDQGQWYRRIFFAKFMKVFGGTNLAEGDIDERLVVEFPIIFHLSAVEYLRLAGIVSGRMPIDSTGRLLRTVSAINTSSQEAFRDSSSSSSSQPSQQPQPQPQPRASARRPRDRSLWDEEWRGKVVAHYFHWARDDLRRELHPLFGILSDRSVVGFGPDRYVLLSEMEERIKHRCQQRRQDVPPFNEIFYDTPLKYYRLKVVSAQRSWRVKMHNDRFIEGITWVDETSPPDDDAKSVIEPFPPHLAPDPMDLPPPNSQQPPPPPPAADQEEMEDNIEDDDFFGAGDSHRNNPPPQPPPLFPPSVMMVDPAFEENYSLPPVRPHLPPVSRASTH